MLFEPMDIRLILVQAFVMLFAITVHEAAHAWTANKMGDPTAAALGRASLNPLVHIDPLGTILFPLFLIWLTKGQGPVFGWAKPVPYNPYNLRRPRKGGLWISFAGPIANILTATVAVVVYKILMLAFSGTAASSAIAKPVIGIITILYATALLNISLAVFNLIPIPPLDGSGILAGLLSEKAAASYERLRPYGFLVLLLIMYTGMLNLIFSPIRNFVSSLFS
jgi:Zn-dependent protease